MKKKKEKKEKEMPIMSGLSIEIKSAIDISSDIRLSKDVRIQKVHDLGYTRKFARYLVTGENW